MEVTPFVSLELLTCFVNASRLAEFPLTNRERLCSWGVSRCMNDPVNAREASLVPADPYYLDQAREICRRVQDKSHLTDDELLVLAMSAAGLALARYVEPGNNRDAEGTLDKILGILDHTDVVAALQSKMDLIIHSPYRGTPRLDAPSGNDVAKQIDLGRDEDEPSGT